jgi:hypothetical protein
MQSMVIYPSAWTSKPKKPTFCMHATYNYLCLQRIKCKLIYPDISRDALLCMVLLAYVNEVRNKYR